jgi:hypothetical protein
MIRNEPRYLGCYSLHTSSRGGERNRVEPFDGLMAGSFSTASAGFFGDDDEFLGAYFEGVSFGGAVNVEGSCFSADCGSDWNE